MSKSRLAKKMRSVAAIREARARNSFARASTAVRDQQNRIDEVRAAQESSEAEFATERQLEGAWLGVVGASRAATRVALSAAAVQLQTAEQQLLAQRVAFEQSVRDSKSAERVLERVETTRRYEAERVAQREQDEVATFRYTSEQAGLQ